MTGAQKTVLDMNKLSQKLKSKESQVGKKAIIQQKEEQLEDELKNSQEALRKSIEERLKQGEVSREEIDNFVESATDLWEFREEELNKIFEDMDRMESQSSN